MTPEQLEVRIAALLDTCTYTVYNYTRRGLFDRDKLIVLTLLTFQILLRSGTIDAAEYEALCKGAKSTAAPPITDDLSRCVKQTPASGTPQAQACIALTQLAHITSWVLCMADRARKPFIRLSGLGSCCSRNALPHLLH